MLSTWFRCEEVVVLDCFWLEKYWRVKGHYESKLGKGLDFKCTNYCHEWVRFVVLLGVCLSA